MIIIIPLILAAALATYPLIVSSEGWVLWLSAASVALWCAGGLSRRYFLCALSCFIMAGEYVGALASGHRTSDLWGAILFGGGLYLELELSYDLTTLFRHRLSRRVYLRRGGYFLKVVLLSMSVSLIVALTAAGVLSRVPASLTPWLTLLGIGIIVGFTGFVIGLRLKEQAGR